ncbi:hypothetical protein IJS64_00220 [bacterium]|nr:hypothetical protein [bacterium]
MFPTTLESIAGHAFKHQNISGKLILPESLTSIAEKAFRGNNIS